MGNTDENIVITDASIKTYPLKLFVRRSMADDINKLALIISTGSKKIFKAISFVEAPFRSLTPNS